LPRRHLLIYYQFHFQPDIKQLKPKPKEIKEDLQALEEEKKEYVEEHPEEEVLPEINGAKKPEEEEKTPEKKVDEASKEGEIVTNVDEAVEKIEEEKKEYLEEGPKEDKGLDIF